MDAYDLDHTSASKDFWEAAAKEKCVVALVVPLEVDKYLGYAQRDIGHVPHRFKYIVVMAQPVTKNQAKKFFHLTDTVIIGYGCTECFGICKTYVDEKSFQSYNCGKHVDIFDVRVVDGKNKTCPPNVTGSIHVKGGFNGYLNKLEVPDPDTLKAFTQDGWLNTDDYGYIDDAGNLFVLGRNKDVINYGTFVIYPCWLEEGITEHPDVIQACVVPVSDPVLHQNICACIKLSTGSTSGAEDIRRYCEQMFLPNTPATLTPKPGFYMFFNEDFPELSSGKPDKVKLINLAEEKFGYKG
ncbi:4-coumarate--CoA ligase 2 [Bulinus truncatus]|nr:4-coumarate--CoA ligase 2 [Bulinus truncatus]